jgi:hypothetical protein
MVLLQNLGAVGPLKTWRAVMAGASKLKNAMLVATWLWMVKLASNKVETTLLEQTRLVPDNQSPDEQKSRPAVLIADASSANPKPRRVTANAPRDGGILGGCVDVISGASYEITAQYVPTMSATVTKKRPWPNPGGESQRTLLTDDHETVKQRLELKTLVAVGSE